MYWVQWLLVTLSCFGYAAAFSLIGVMFPKRTMVFGVVYAILFELVSPGWWAHGAFACGVLGCTDR